MNFENSKHSWGRASLPGLFRSIGTVSILLTALSFLLFGSSSTADGTRYIYLLLFTALSACSGIGAGKIWGDSAAARNLLAITAALLPVHACILGAFLLSSVGYGEFSSYPHALIWSVDSFGEALTFLLLGFPLLSLFSALAFAVLEREKAWLYSLCYAAGNILLLLPVRSPFFSVCCFLGACALGLYAAKDTLGHSFAERTRESLMCSALLFSPAISIAVRALFGAENFSLMLGSSLFLVAYFLYLSSSEFEGYLKKLLYSLSSVSQFFAAYLVSVEIFNELIPNSYRSYAILFFFSLFACSNLLYLLSTKADKDAILRRALYSFSLGAFIQFLISMSVLSALLVVLFGTVFIAIDWVRSSSSYRVIGIVQLIAGILFNVQLAVSEAFQLNSWLGLSVLGLTLILGANTLSRLLQKLISPRGGLLEQAG